MHKILPFILLLLALTSCKTSPYAQSRSDFLQTRDPQWAKWLDETVDANIKDSPIWYFRENPQLGFKGVPIFLLGNDANHGIVSIEEKDITRRELLWEVHKQLDVVIDFATIRGIKGIRIRSKEYIRLTSP